LISTAKLRKWKKPVKWTFVLSSFAMFAFGVFGIYIDSRPGLQDVVGAPNVRWIYFFLFLYLVTLAAESYIEFVLWIRLRRADKLIPRK
jgi:DMSO/TMAO reductase YedYZ heme-binding membrane subunit